MEVDITAPKLYLCSANAIDYEPTGVTVAFTEEMAIKQFDEYLDQCDIWHAGTITADLIDELDGYEIQLIKKKGETDNEK